MKPVIDPHGAAPLRRPAATPASASPGILQGMPERRRAARLSRSDRQRAPGLQRLRSYRAGAICRLWRGLFRIQARPGDGTFGADLRGMLGALIGPVGRRMGRRVAGLHARRHAAPRLPGRMDPWGRAHRSCGAAPAAARDGSGR